jgi:hypothetical protein
MPTPILDHLRKRKTYDEQKQETFMHLVKWKKNKKRKTHHNKEEKEKEKQFWLAAVATEHKQQLIDPWVEKCITEPPFCDALCMISLHPHRTLSERQLTSLQKEIEPWFRQIHNMILFSYFYSYMPKMNTYELEKWLPRCSKIMNGQQTEIMQNIEMSQFFLMDFHTDRCLGERCLELMQFLRHDSLSKNFIKEIQRKASKEWTKSCSGYQQEMMIFWDLAPWFLKNPLFKFKFQSSSSIYYRRGSKKNDIKEWKLLRLTMKSSSSHFGGSNLKIPHLEMQVKYVNETKRIQCVFQGNGNFVYGNFVSFYLEMFTLYSMNSYEMRKNRQAKTDEDVVPYHTFLMDPTAVRNSTAWYQLKNMLMQPLTCHWIAQYLLSPNQTWLR